MKSNPEPVLNINVIFILITAFEMMKLFVFANTIMLIVTMAWPNIKEQFYMLNQWWESFREQQQQ